jgi:hypothetical protein
MMSLYQNAALKFFYLDYGPLFFAKYLELPVVSNVEFALREQGHIEEERGDLFSNNEETLEAIAHYNIAIDTYANLEMHDKAADLRVTRQSIGMARNCWFCGNRVVGLRKHFNFQFTGLGEEDLSYMKKLLQQRMKIITGILEDTIYTTETQDHIIRRFTPQRGIYIAVCTVCQGVIEQDAHKLIQAALVPVRQELNSLNLRVDQLNNNFIAIASDVGVMRQQITRIFGELQSMRGYVGQHPGPR